MRKIIIYITAWLFIVHQSMNAQPLAYVTNDTGTVSVVNLSTNTIIATIPIGLDPSQALLTPNNQKLYTYNRNGLNISVIDTASNSVTATIGIPRFPSTIRPLDVSPDGTKLYAGIDFPEIYSVETNAFIGSIVGGAENFAISPDQSFAYAAAFGPSRTNRFNLIDNTLETSFGEAYEAYIFSPLGSFAYAIRNASPPFLAVINTRNNTLVTTIPVGTTPVDLDITPDGKTIYVVNEGSVGNVTVIDTDSNVVVATINVGDDPSGVDFAFQGTRAYVTNFNDDNISIIDVASNTIIGTISGFSSPTDIVIQSISGLNVQGRAKENKFLTQTELFNEITWSNPRGFSPTEFRVFRDSRLIATVPSGSPLIFQDHNLPKNRRFTYRVNAMLNDLLLKSETIRLKTKS